MDDRALLTPPPRQRAAAEAPRAVHLQDFPSVFGDFPVPTALLGADGRVLRVNAALCALLGSDESGLLGRCAAELAVEQDRPAVGAAVAELLATREGSRQDVERYGSTDDPVTAVVSRTVVGEERPGAPLALQQLVVPSALPAAAGAAQASTSALRSAQSLLRLNEELALPGRSLVDLCGLALTTLVEDVGGDGTVWLTDSADGVTLEAVAVRAEPAEAQDELVRLYSLVQQRLDSGFPARMLAEPEGYLLAADPFSGAGSLPPAMPEFLPWLHAHPVTALLFVPLVHGDRVLGVLGLGRHGSGESYDAAQVAFVRQVARRLSRSLADVTLRAVEEARARRERALAAVSRTVDEAVREPTRLLPEVVATVAGHLDGACGLRLVGAAAGYLGAVAVHHPDPAAAEVLQRYLLLDRPGGFVERVQRDGHEHLSSPDVGRLIGQVGALRGLPPPVLTAVYGVRLQSRGEPLGILAVGRPDGTFSVEERRLLDVLADRLSLALDNAALLAATQASQRRHQALVQHSSDLLLVADVDGRTTYASPSAALRLRGVVGARLADDVVPAERERFGRFWEGVLAAPGSRPPVDVLVQVPGGGERALQVRANNLLADPAVAGIVLTVRDVTDEREASRALVLRAEQQSALAGISTRALTSDGLDQLFDHAVHAVNRVLASGSTGLLELMPEGDLLIRAGTLDGVGVGTTRLPADGSFLSRVVATREPVVVEDYLQVDADSRRQADAYGVRSGALVPVVVDGGVWGVLSCHSEQPRCFAAVDVDFLRTACTVLAGAVQRRQVEGQVRHQATHDALTGLPNRSTLRQRLQDALATGRGEVGLLLLDLDDFKDVNDSLGHGAGDLVLEQLGRRLQDVVGGDGTVARLGGDEFAVCLERSAAVDDAVFAAAAVLDALRAPFSLPGLDLTLSASIGIALAPEHGTEPGRLLQHADLAMYRAKSTRNGWALFDAALDRERSERLSLLVDLRDALAHGGLTLHYQPLVDLRDGSVREVEALVRWHHPTRGLLLPGVFVPLAEQTDLIDDLTLRVAEQSAAQARAWAAEGYQVAIACNVSPTALRDRSVVVQLADVLASAPGLVGVEITESALVEESSREGIARLAAAGASCAVDDFGTGYSALAYLRTLPVDRLKVDRAFNHSVDTNARDATLVAGVVRMAHDLGLEVVAEGVERASVAEALEGLGVDLAQGWLYGRAEPPDRLDRSRWRRR